MATNSSCEASQRRRRNEISSAIRYPSRVTVKDCPCSTASMISRDRVRRSRWLTVILAALRRPAPVTTETNPQTA
jgi:hypothetical protein